MGDRSASNARGPLGAGVAFGLLTGLTIGGYTLFDAYAVHNLLVPPILEAWSSEAGRAILLAPFALRRPGGVGEVWRQRRREVLGTGIFSPLAYLLVLVALSIAPIVEVAPVRELSVVLGVLAGRRLLGEGHARLRLLAALLVIMGVVAIALA
jgi:drug/metabolite transporter (DMT)-like permease